MLWLWDASPPSACHGIGGWVLPKTEVLGTLFPNSLSQWTGYLIESMT